MSEITVGSLWRHKTIPNRRIKVIGIDMGPSVEVEVVSDFQPGGIPNGTLMETTTSTIESHFMRIWKRKSGSSRPDRYATLNVGETLYIECDHKSPTIKQQNINASLLRTGGQVHPQGGALHPR